MDEPSAQLLLDLNRVVQHELAALRPLLHRLNHSSYLLQIPRPANAIRHGSRFYYNILLNPRLDFTDVQGQKKLADGPHSTVETVEEIEELLKSIELLAGEARLRKKSNNTAQDELDKLETLVDATLITESAPPAEHSLLRLQPNVPIFASEEAATRIRDLQRFRSVVAFPSFDDHDCNDWRSTAIPPLPEWVGVSRLACGNDAAQAPLMIAFNNHHHNRATHSRRPEVTAVQRAKRHRTFASNDTEETAEAVFLTQSGLLDEELQLLSCADPPIHPLAVSYTLPLANSLASVSTAMDVDAEGYQGKPETTPKDDNTHHIYPRNVVPAEEQGFFAWLLEKARLSFRGERREKSVISDFQAGDVDKPDQGSKYVELGQGESKILL